jgi:hypothetical protein
LLLLIFLKSCEVAASIDGTHRGFALIFGRASKLRVIEESAFRQCMPLQAVGFPPSLEIPTNSCFMSCLNLQRVAFPENTKLRSIAECRQLPSIRFPPSLEALVPSCFKTCSALSAVHFRPDCRLVRIPEAAFQGYRALEALSLPASSEDHAFAGCAHLLGFAIRPLSRLRELLDLPPGWTGSYDILDSVEVLANLRVRLMRFSRQENRDWSESGRSRSRGRRPDLLSSYSCQLGLSTLCGRPSSLKDRSIVMMNTDIHDLLGMNIKAVPRLVMMNTENRHLSSMKKCSPPLIYP